MKKRRKGKEKRLHGHLSGLQNIHEELKESDRENTRDDNCKY
jgi:hypothetical protein